jgi:hypothetical protein
LLLAAWAERDGATAERDTITAERDALAEQNDRLRHCGLLCAGVTL